MYFRSTSCVCHCHVHRSGWVFRGLAVLLSSPPHSSGLKPWLAKSKRMHIVCIVVHCTTRILIFHINSINKVPITNGIGATWNAAWNVSVQVELRNSFDHNCHFLHHSFTDWPFRIYSQIILITNIIFPFRHLRRFRYFFGCD